MYTVLLPVDGDEGRVTAQAETVRELPAAADSVEVIMLHVFDSRERAEKTVPAQVGANDLARETLVEAGIEVGEESRVGNPASEIVAVAAEIDADMIVLGGRKRSTLGSTLFGSVSQDVLLEADRPVVITGSVENRTEPSHRCQSCGEEYYTEPGMEINTCRQCGGTKVKPIE